MDKQILIQLPELESTQLLGVLNFIVRFPVFLAQNFRIYVKDAERLKFFSSPKKNSPELETLIDKSSERQLNKD